MKRNGRALTLRILALMTLTGALAACGAGSGGGTIITPPPASSAPYLFTASNGQVWSFAVNSSTGALGSGTSVAVSGLLSQGIVADPAGKFLYVSDAAADQVHVFSISSNGSLTEIGGSPYTVGTPGGQTSASGEAMDSNGKFLYVTDLSNNDVAGFTVNSSTGALTAMNPATFPTGTTPVQVVVDSSNSYVYVSDYNDVLGGIFAFSLDSTSGVLTPVPGSSPFSLPTLNAGAIGLATTGQYVYVAEQNYGNVAGLSIISGTGGLNTLISSPFAAGNGPTGVVIAPSGKFLYAANYTDATISAYSVDSTAGGLTAVTNSPFTATAAPWYLAIDPSGKFLYATNPGSSDNSISGFTINTSTGTLSQFSGSPTAAGTQPVALTVVNVPQ